MFMITQVSLEEQMRANPRLDKLAIAELKEWSLQQNHLPKLADAELSVFYLNNSYDMEATKRNINNYFIMRHHMPEYFAVCKDIQSSELKKVFDSVLIVTLPQRTKENHKVILARLLDTDPANYNFSNSVKVMNMVMDVEVYEDGPDNKYVLVFDLNGTTMDHRNTLTWLGMKKFYDYMLKGSPVKWIGAHYTNTSTEKTDFQEFVKSHIINDHPMIHFHDDMDALLDAIGMERAMLPKDMGGQASSAVELQKQQMKKIESNNILLTELSNKVKLVNIANIPSALDIFGPEKAL